MKPGNPNIISEWLVRSQKLPLTVIAEFTDVYEHPACRHEDSATATLACTDVLDVCPRHKAVLSLNQLLPHRPRICHLDISVRFSDPCWEEVESEEEPPLLYHRFFREPLPNLQSLGFRADHIEQPGRSIPVSDLLFAGELPRLEKLEYFGVTGGLTKTAKNLVSCQIGPWLGHTGFVMLDPEELQILFDNNKTLNSLTITSCDISTSNDPWVPVATPMTDLEYLEIECPIDDSLEQIVNCIHAPQFKNLDAIQLFPHFSGIRAVTTDGSGRTFKFSQCIMGDTSFWPLRHLGADITTLRFSRGKSFWRFDERPALHEFFRSLDAVQVLEFDGSLFYVKNVLPDILSITGVFPGLKVIRVATNRDDCKGVLRLLATALRLRMEEGNLLTTVEPLLEEGEDVLGWELRAEWEKHYEAEGIQNLLSR